MNDVNRLAKYMRSGSFRRHQAARQRATVGGASALTFLKWTSLIQLLANSAIVGHVVGGNQVSKLVFNYPDGNQIEVPAGCKMLEIHIE